ncbi:histidine phosphatase family protein (plasmid) [Azospirillum argentinense]|uniref:Histidine phosphatase family protein n=1 Tax=Azospirillum argentinense TaxID=2970906 RepID=A0A4D8PND3_9PROT|nr:histidine phosphatase family protein [Azospirillum argentinense]QCN97168.1 histidine phosphatase family protein [Azospirillum argentinense]
MPKLVRRRSLAVAIAAILIVFSVSANRAAPSAAVDPKGLIVLMRHAEAPGVGDPPNFRLRDCATQRNLDASGREQARRAGDLLRTMNSLPAAVYSSQWCRCLETAQLLEIGPVQELPVLNSFFDRREEQEAQIASLRRFLAGLPADGAPVVLVTHQVVVTALTGVFPASGEAVLLRANGTGDPAIEGRITVEDPK